MLLEVSAMSELVSTESNSFTILVFLVGVTTASIAEPGERYWFKILFQ